MELIVNIYYIHDKEFKNLESTILLDDEMKLEVSHR